MKKYSNRTLTRALKMEMTRSGASYTLMSVTFPAGREDIRKVWKTALRQALRIFRNRNEIEYLILYETSETGFVHAHVILVKMVKSKFKRLSKDMMAEIRRLVFLKTYQKLKGLDHRTHTEKSVTWLCKKLKIDRSDMIRNVQAYRDKQNALVNAGYGTGIFDYFMEKPELVTSQRSVLSVGLRNLRVSKSNRFDVKGWKQHGIRSQL
jgi:hypothetical protein